MIEGEIEIQLPKELQSNNFADEYLAIQALSDQPMKKMSVVFAGVLWIDNLAMIQLFLMLFNFKKKGVVIEFKIETDSNNIEELRFIKYMEDYGFINIMSKISDNFDCSVISNLYSENVYTELAKGNFENSECFMPFDIIEKKDDILKYVKKVIDKFGNLFANYFSEYEKENLIFRMSIFLQETITNVFDHAFTKSDNAFCGVMIRYMHKNGHNHEKNRYYYNLRYEESASQAFRNAGFTYKNLEQVAKKHNPYRNETAIDVLEKYMQIFVSDIGMGILDSMDISDPGAERNLINEIFDKGRRTTKKVRNTYIGGLGMLYQLLQREDNYISVKAEYNWAKITCSQNKRDTNGTLEYVHKSGKTDTNVLKGFTIVGYIDCNYEKRKKLFKPIDLKYIENLYQDGYILSDMSEIPNTQVMDFRKSIPDFSDIILRSGTILCFVGRNLEKGLWSNRIATLYNKSKIQDKILILVDIPEREIRKYELIFEKFREKVNMIIMLSCNYELAILTYSHQKKALVFDIKATKEYMGCHEDDITKSLYALLKVIRKYDSQLIWKTISKIQGSKGKRLFVNGKVKWNLENEGYMEGYLDFSQACFDEDINSLLMAQLYRLPRKKNDENYFVSMDRFTEDLCENINSKLKVPSREERDIDVQLGSVYVTGTSSKKSKLDAEKIAEREYYYFWHPLINGDDTDKANALLLWPSKEIVEILFGEEDTQNKYERLVKTPFLAPEGTTYFAKQHYMSSKDSIALKPEEFYSVLQKDKLWTNRLIKIAHIDMIDHHDFMYLNAVSIFNKHYMESRYVSKYVEGNSFDYLLCKMYAALGRTKSKKYVDSIKIDIQEKYRDIVAGKVNEDQVVESQGLFVYLTDYETMEIVSRLKEIFADEIQKRIIPIAPVSKQRSSAALLMSPVLTESIREKMTNIGVEEERRVTIFIACVTSTRLQRELKHILYRLGAEKIKCISLIDRQRFPLGSREKDTYNSFCKADLPHLGSRHHCKLCQGINRLNELQSQLISKELQGRCKKIKLIWSAIKASDNLYEKGIQACSYDWPVSIRGAIQKVCEQYQQSTSFNISTDVGLVLFSVENAVITMSTDFLMQCLHNNKVADEVKILMISAHLILFDSGEIVLADRYFLAEYLYGLLQKQPRANEYTALACITILLQKDAIRKKLYDYYQKNWYLEYFNNEDFIITSVGLMSALDKRKQDDLLRYWLKYSDVGHMEYLYGIYLLTDGSGRRRHGTILSKMIEIGRSFSSMEYLSAANDIDFLMLAYKDIPDTYFMQPHLGHQKRNELIGKLGEVKGLLDTILNDKDITDDIRDSLSKSICKMFQSATELNQELFGKTEENFLSGLRRRLQELAEKNSQSSNGVVTCYVNVIEYSGEFGEKYFCYLEDLQREILYLMGDFRYADKKKLMKGQDGEMYSGILEVKFERDHMRYCFSNYVAENFRLEEVEKKKRLKYSRPTIATLQLLFAHRREGKLFHYVFDKQNKIFTVELSVPYLNV